MKAHSLSIRLSDEAYEKLLRLEATSGQNKSQIVHSLLLESTPTNVVDRSRKNLPNLSLILYVISEDETDKADQLRQEVNYICQFLKK